MLARIGILKGLRSNNGPIVRSSVSPEVNGTDSFRGKAAGESNPLRLTDLNPTTRQAPQYAKRATRRSSAGQRCELRRERVAMLRKIALLTISAFGLTNIASGENKTTELGSAGTKALAYFQGIAERSLDDYLKRVRPPRVSAALKARIIAQLPHEGEVKPSTKMQAKLAALAPILRYHERSSTTEIKMISVGHAFIGLHARAILLVSEDALEILTTEELQAATAHEMGHEYFWQEYELSREAGHNEAIREIEMRCDGIALITMRSLGLDASHLISQVVKMTRFNEQLRATGSATRYPSLGERVEFIRAMTDLVNGSLTRRCSLGCGQRK